MRTLMICLVLPAVALAADAAGPPGPWRFDGIVEKSSAYALKLSPDGKHIAGLSPTPYGPNGVAAGRDDGGLRVLVRQDQGQLLVPARRGQRLAASRRISGHRQLLDSDLGADPTRFARRLVATRARYGGRVPLRRAPPRACRADGGHPSEDIVRANGLAISTAVRQLRRPGADPVAGRCRPGALVSPWHVEHGHAGNCAVPAEGQAGRDAPDGNRRVPGRRRLEDQGLPDAPRAHRFGAATGRAHPRRPEPARPLGLERGGAVARAPWRRGIPAAVSRLCRLLENASRKRAMVNGAWPCRTTSPPASGISSTASGSIRSASASTAPATAATPRCRA